MGALIAVAVGGAWTDSGVADVIARQHGGVAVGAVVGREHVHHVIDPRMLRSGAQLLMGALEQGLLDVQEAYPRYLKIQTKERRNER